MINLLFKSSIATINKESIITKLGSLSKMDINNLNLLLEKMKLTDELKRREDEKNFNFNSYIFKWV